MIDHITLTVTDVEKSRAFYRAAFEPLGYEVAFGKEGVFWAFDIGDGLFEIAQAEPDKVVGTTHIALRFDSEEAVNVFHKTALAAGAQNNGDPGPRREYTENYYAAFFFDPDGNNIEGMFDKK